MACLLLARGAAYAETDPSKDGKAAVETAAAPSRIQLSGWVEGGITLNPASPSSHENFGNYVNDRANEPILNQFVLQAERPLDPAAQGFDWGFKAQGLFGTDGRYYHNTGEFDRTMHEGYQFALTEVYLNLHLPVLTEGGLDVKLGQFPTIEGIEGVPAVVNTFYSHSYIYHYGVPAYNLGGMGVLHVNKTLDLYAGVNRGLGAGVTDNNSTAAFEGGIGLNLLEDKLTIIAATNIGPQIPDNNHDMRFINDIAVTWKATDKLTFMTDINYDEDTNNTVGRCYGISQYATYAFNNWLSLGARAEVFRDEKGGYVFQPGSSTDFTHIMRGETDKLDSATSFVGPATYSEYTVGMNIRPPAFGWLKGIIIRPEVRYDRALNGTKAYDDGTKEDQWTIACDVIFAF